MNPPPFPSPMELLFHAMGRLLHAKVEKDKTPSLAKGSQVIHGLVDLYETQGIYDPKCPVGPHRLPLVHALNRLQDLPVAWLNFFAESTPDCAMFENVQGENLGTRMFDRLMAQEHSFASPAFQWWIKNTPEIPVSQSQAWMIALSKRKTGARYNSGLDRSRDGEVQAFIGLLVDRGALLPMEEVGRPAERWLHQQIWWETLAAQGRLQERVRAPSGAERTMEDMLQFGDSFGSFLRWKEKEDPPRELQAPHGRKKELMDYWVLHSQSASSGERAKRLAASIIKSDGVLDELAERCEAPKPRKSDIRPLLREIFDYRCPSGMNLAGWFLLRHGSQLDWPGIVSSLWDLSPSQGIQSTISPDGAGLLLQGLRASLGNGREEFPYWNNGSPRFTSDALPLSKEFEKAIVGDPRTHGELVDLLVDTLVCPSPSTFSKSASNFLLKNSLLDPCFCARLSQAVRMSDLSAKIASSIDFAKQASAPHKKKHFYFANGTRSKDDAMSAMRELLEDFKQEGCLLSMTARDWDGLLVQWNATSKSIAPLGPQFQGLFNALVDELRSHGERLSLAEQTRPSNPAIKRMGPRL